MAKQKVRTPSTAGDPTQEKSKKNKAHKEVAAKGKTQPGKPTQVKSHKTKKKLDKSTYEAELERLQLELVKMQAWVKQAGLKVVVLFEGRDAAGKGGVIKRIAECLNPRGCRIVALGTPQSERKPSGIFNAMSASFLRRVRLFFLTAAGTTGQV